MPVEYDFQKYKPLVREYVKALRPSCDAGNFQCLNPAHNDGGSPSQWSMGWGKQPYTLHCYGCGTGGHDWDIYDLVGALEGIPTKGEQYKRVAAIAGDVVGSAEKWVCPPSVAPEPEFIPDEAAIEAVYQWLREIRPQYVERINAFCQFRKQPSDWGNRLAWWPGLSVARGALSEETITRAGLVDPSKPTAAFNAEGAIVRLGRGFKLHYAGKPDADGHIPTVKRGSRGCHTFPYPALPEGDTVVLVEGELDAVSGRYAGITAVSIGGTNGLNVSDIDALTGRRVILALDNDDAGHKATHKISRMFRSCLSVDWSLPECTGEKDIDDMVKHGKSDIVLKMIDDAKEVEDVQKETRGACSDSDTEGVANRGQGDQGNRAQHDAGSAGAANHGNDKRHESAHRSDAGECGESEAVTAADSAGGAENGADERVWGWASINGQGGVNGRNDDARAMGRASVSNDTGTRAGETGYNSGSPRGRSNTQTTRSVSFDALSPHDEDGTVTPSDIPFQFLGFDDASYYFLPKRQNVPLRIARGQTSMKNQMTELAPMDWWMSFFSRVNDKGEETLDVVGALQWLREGSTRKGMYNEELLLGTGAYKDGDRVIVNTGSAIVDPSGTVSRYEDYTGRLAFTRAKVELKVDAEPWTTADGRFFYDQLKTFGFDQPLAYYAVAGWCAIAPFASFLFRRPHIWITARRGTGKTFLVDRIISPLLGEDYVFYTDGSTEAGIRQSLRRDNRPVILDEFEANKKYDLDSLDRILELSRSAYGGKKKVKGSSSQTAISFTLRVMFCFASINVNIGNDADRSRIAVCRMTESVGRMKTIPNPDGLRARMFARLEEINPNILALHARMEDMGYEDRTADTYSPLLIGMWMTLSDARFPASDDERDALSETDRRLFDHLLNALPQTAQTEEKRPDEERILEEVFQSRIRLESGSEKTVAEMLTTLDDFKKLVYDDHIQRFGLKRGKDRAGEYLAVVHDSKEVKAMLKETPFAASYKEVLKRNPAYIGTKQIHVAKQQMSCIMLRWSDIEARYFKEETDVVPF